MSKVKVRAAFNSQAFQAVAFCAKVFNVSVEDYVTMCCLAQTQQYIDAAEKAQKERENNEREADLDSRGGDRGDAVSGDEGANSGGTQEEEGAGQEEA